jgi:hypothetical protein
MDEEAIPAARQRGEATDVVEVSGEALKPLLACRERERGGWRRKDSL